MLLRVSFKRLKLLSSGSCSSSCQRMRNILAFQLATCHMISLIDMLFKYGMHYVWIPYQLLTNIRDFSSIGDMIFYMGWYWIFNSACKFLLLLLLLLLHLPLPTFNTHLNFILGCFHASTFGTVCTQV